MTDEVTVMHGDCLELMKGIPDGSVDVVMADPPYGARRPSAWRSATERFEEVDGNDGVHPEWLAGAFRVLADGGCAYVFCCWDRLEEWRAAMSDVGLKVRSCIVWDKMDHGLADLKTCWAPQHEMVLFGAKGRHELSGKRPKDVLRVPRVPSSKLDHPYQKPVPLVIPLIEASSRPNGVVLDPFAGSGTTGVACRKAGRQCILIEKDEQYIPIIRRRLRDAATPLFDEAR